MIDRTKISRFEIRFFEMVPAVVTWLVLLSPLLLAFYFPAAVAIFVILFDIYWLLRSVRLNFDLLQSYGRLKRALAIDWHAKLLTQVPQNDWPFQVVVLPYYQEDIEILRVACASITKQQYPLKKIFVLLAIEERGGAQILASAKTVQAEFSDVFGDIRVYVHPDNIVGEVKAKGPNINYAMQAFEQEVVVPQKLDPNNMLINCFDGDVALHVQHCAHFSSEYLTNNRDPAAIYQFIPMYHNNIWDTPSLMRVVATGSSFWLMMEANQPKKLHTFTCYGLSLVTLRKDEYWDKTSIIEDGVQYWRHLIAFGGHGYVAPVFSPVYLDAVLNEGYIRTYVGQYVQLRRWAWGASDLALIMPEFLRNKEIPLSVKISEVMTLFGGHIPRATAPLLLFVSGWFPLLNEQFRGTVLAFNLPIITSNLLTLAMLGLSSIIVVGMMLLPTPNRKYPWHTHVMQVLQWAFSPFVTIIFGAIPAIDAQTRLAFGKRLEWMVTEKKR